MKPFIVVRTRKKWPQNFGQILKVAECQFFNQIAQNKNFLNCWWPADKFISTRDQGGALKMMLAGAEVAF